MGVYLTTNRAGVIGLQTSLTLLKAGHKVTVIAEHLPGDESIAYTSPWAGAIWRSHATAEQEEDCAWDMRSYATWMRIAKQDPEQAQKMGMQECLITVLSEIASEPFYARQVHGYKSLGCAQALSPPQGHQFVSVSINPGSYLSYLHEQAQSAGVHFIQAALPTLNGLAASLLHADKFLHIPLDELDAVVNCTGLSAQRLCNDQNLFPVRGQTLLARIEPPLNREILLWETKDAVTYIVPRPGTDLFVLGGTKTRNDYDPIPTPSVSEDILQRCKRLLSSRSIEVSKIDVVKEQVGLRPGRLNGKRVEAELVKLGDGRQVQLIHNYGHAGTGFQVSIGSADRVLQLVGKSSQK